MGFWDIFYPKRCVICDRVLKMKETEICAQCKDLPLLIGEDFCMKCGKSVPQEQEYCEDCQSKKTTFLCGRSVFSYNRDLRRSIARFKYHGRQEYASYYGRMMYQVHKEWLQQVQPDMLLPVPVHKKRLQQRGYNQAELLAKELGRYANLPVVADLLIRQENTLPQKELSAQERLSNLQGAFVAKEAELYTNVNCVIIVDDIYTTGSTIEACSQVMRKIGVQNIYFLCLCSGQAE